MSWTPIVTDAKRCLLQQIVSPASLSALKHAIVREATLSDGNAAGARSFPNGKNDSAGLARHLLG